MKTAFYTDPIAKKHLISATHPESPARLDAINAAIKHAGLWDALQHIDVVPLAPHYLELGHTKKYIEYIQSIRPTLNDRVMLDGDTAMNAFSYDAATRAVSACIDAVDKVVSGDIKNAFCAMRPPGHHSEKDQAMGFCIFNPVAIAAKYAQKQYDLRVAIVDFDVHHGNGTEDIVSDDANILFCSLFQQDAYPGRYGENIDGQRLNIAMPSGANRAIYQHHIEHQLLPALEQFKPQLLLFSAGFDAHIADPLAQQALVAQDFAWMTQVIMDKVQSTTHGKTVSTLEGGYNLNALGQSVVAHLEVLIAR